MYKVLEILDSDTYLVQLPHGIYKIDGEVVCVEGYGKNTLQVKDVDNIIPISMVQVVSHYVVDGDEDNLVSVSEYKDTIAKLTEGKREWDDDYEEYRWNTLEDEFAYRKYVETYRVIYKSIVTEGDPLPIQKIPVQIDHGLPCVTPLFFSADLKEDGLYSLDVESLEKLLVKEICEKYNLSFEIPQHNHLTYLKVEGAYLNLGGKPRSKILNLEGCKAFYSATEKEFKTNILAIAAVQKKLASGDDIFVKDIYEGLSKLSSQIALLDVKAKSSSIKTTVLQTLSKLERDLKFSLEKVAERELSQK